MFPLIAIATSIIFLFFIVFRGVRFLLDLSSVLITVLIILMLTIGSYYLFFSPNPNYYLDEVPEYPEDAEHIVADSIAAEDRKKASKKYIYTPRKSMIKASIPDTMKVGMNYRVTLKAKHGIKVNETIEIEYARQYNGLDQKKIQKNIEEEGEFTIVDTIQIATYATASIIDVGENFVINPLFSNSTRILDTIAFKFWEWNVTPKNKGLHELIVTLNSEVLHGDENMPIEKKAFERSILVKANPYKATASFFNDNWQYLMGALVIPLFLYGRNQWLKSRNKEQPPNEIGF
ncbi:MAG: hypothetical protein AAGG68_14865 [Bacteroidota bacterium]